MFNLRFKVAAIAIGSAILCGTAIAMTTVVGATSTPAGGLIRYWVTQTTPQTESIVVAGAIGDFGTVTTVDKNGVADQNGNYALVTLQKGTIMVNLTSWNKKNAKVSFPINQRSCSSEGTATGTVSLSNGTGHYKGISGHLSYSETNAWILARSANGKCSGSDVLHYLALTSGAGSVSF
jgi:hypothetical protein